MGLPVPGIRDIISDYIDAQPGPDLTEKDLKAFAELERIRFYDSPDHVQAMVATDPKTLAYVRYYESLRLSPYCLRTFTTIAEAREWIASNPRLGWSRPQTSRHPGRSVDAGLTPSEGPLRILEQFESPPRRTCGRARRCDAESGRSDR